VESQASEVERLIEALYGTRSLLARGTVHVTAAKRAADGALRVLRIGEGAPKSATDFFILNLCRARCDAILTTAANLRSEANLQHDLQGPFAEALAHYRRDVLKKSEPPVCAILTRSGAVPADHPVWSDGTRKLVLSTGEPDAALTVAGHPVRIVQFEELDARGACAFLRSQGHALVSVEAGPTTASTLYGIDSPVDELLLSLYEGERSDVELGGLLPGHHELTRERVCVADSVRDEESGRWRFQRWLHGDDEQARALNR